MNHFEEVLIYKIPVEDSGSHIFCFALFIYNYLGKEILGLVKIGQSSCAHALGVAQTSGQGESVVFELPHNPDFQRQLSLLPTILKFKKKTVGVQGAWVAW